MQHPVAVRADEGEVLDTSLSFAVQMAQGRCVMRLNEVSTMGSTDFPLGRLRSAWEAGEFEENVFERARPWHQQRPGRAARAPSSSSPGAPSSPAGRDRYGSGGVAGSTTCPRPTSHGPSSKVSSPRPLNRSGVIIDSRENAWKSACNDVPPWELAMQYAITRFAAAKHASRAFRERSRLHSLAALARVRLLDAGGSGERARQREYQGGNDSRCSYEHLQCEHRTTANRAGSRHRRYARRHLMSRHTRCAHHLSGVRALSRRRASERARSSSPEPCFARRPRRDIREMDTAQEIVARPRSFD